VAFRYPLEHRSAWPDDAGLPFCIRRRPTALLGFNTPFAGLLPQPGGRVTRASAQRTSGTPSCSSWSTFLPVRAHVPFVPLTSAPIDFRRGDRSPVGGNTICKSDRPGMWMASTSGLRLPSAVRRPGARLAGQTILALGFASCRVVGHVAVHRPGSTPLPITSLRNTGRTTLFAAGDSYPLMGLLDVPSHHARAGCDLRGELPPRDTFRRARVIAKY
jgi:hypothetical protein